MNTRKSAFIPGVGEIVIARNKLASKISIKVKPGGVVTATIPWRGSFSDAETFLIQKQDWIRQAVSKTQQLKKIFDRNQKQVTMFHDLELLEHELPQVRLRVANKVVAVYRPREMPASDPVVQEAIRKGLDFAMKQEARKYLHFRIDQLAQQHGLSYKRLSIRDPKTRWGSCSGDNSINLSYQLMRLPSHLIDYVILHELAHTIHKNHGKDFWKYLEQLTGNARKYAREMKQYSTTL
jgi:predicted metal-dependent hydrolase